MKKIYPLLIVIMMMSVFSCSKSSSPTPATVYSVVYDIASTGEVTMDTIQYKNVNGELITITGTDKLDYSFTSSGGYDAELYMSGGIKGGSVAFGLTVESNSSIVVIDTTGYSWFDTAVNYHFSYRSKKSYSSTK